MAETVYEPTWAHQHESPSKSSRLHGAIIKCGCGKYLYLSMITDEYGHSIWRPVRWYHWRKRSIIRSWEA